MAMGGNRHPLESELLSMISQFRVYEVPANQAEARAVVPYEFLKQVAVAKYESSSTSSQSENNGNRDNVIQDMFLLELMNWFKNDFFTWMNSPNCPSCGQSTTGVGEGAPTVEEGKKGAARVELFTCRNCFTDNREVARFPRYNDPVHLLTARTGRCGEWANCFALVCRAAGFEVRHVRDWTDHVWLEVFSHSQNPNRWVHVDPCENKYDAPFLYDKGWGKKLSYVFAVSQDDIQDVTWRYVQECNEKVVLARRNHIHELQLVGIIRALRNQLQRNLPESRKRLLQQRLIQELVELMYPRHNQSVKDAEMEGRESGSLAWRLARQELGSGVGGSNDVKCIWKIGSDNIVDRKYLFKYDVANDEYTVHKNGIPEDVYERKSGFAKGALEARNIFRKVEHDWKMVYLARQEQSTSKQATISWRFSVTDPSLEIKAIQLRIVIAVFNPTANILITLTDDKGNLYKIIETNADTKTVTYNSASEDSFMSCHTLTLTCKLQGGEGEVGWQYAQLFRQGMHSEQNYPLELLIELGPKSC